MMRTFVNGAAVAAAALLAAPVTADAAIILTSVTPGAVPFSGPLPTYDFEDPAPVTGGAVTNTSPSGLRAQPLGSTGFYWAVGPGNGAGDDGILNLSSIGDIYNISFIWGSVDDYNYIDFIDVDGVVIDTFSGLDIVNPANGDQSSPNQNPLVRFDVTGEHVGRLASLRLRSTSNAFETDNFTINAVPEPGTWALMLLGFAFVGIGLRRRRSLQFA